MNKKEVLHKIIDEQKKIIDNLQTSINRYKSAGNRDDNNTLDPEDYSHQDEAKEMKMRLEEILYKEQRDLNIIENCLNSKNNQIEKGALVETEQYYIFIGISIPRFNIDKKEVITISEKAPIFNTIKDKKVGNEITIGTQIIKIATIS
jgi:hypothetical protein